MSDKKLFTIGNLFTGDVYAVEAVRPFDNIDIHGPFKSENEANNYAHGLALKSETVYDRIEVIIIDLKLSPGSKRIVRDNGAATGYSYA